jgi:pyruvate dehydrogenase E1 component beta subunit
MTYLEAAQAGIREEFRRDSSVIAMGEDARTGLNGATPGLVDEFGPERVWDMPLSEAGFTGAAIGAAMTGLRPIVDITMATFFYNSFDEIMGQAAKNRFLFGGQATMPMVMRGVYMYAYNSAQHADRNHPMFMNQPGLKIVAPASPADAKGLWKTAIRDNDPVMLFEDTTLWFQRGPVPEGDHLVPLGVADIKRSGTDVTIVAISGAVRTALAAAEDLAKEGISAEVIDPRSLVPFDWNTVLESVVKTRRLIAVDIAHRTCSAASEIVATVMEEAPCTLLAPPIRVTTPDTHIPHSAALRVGLLPTKERVMAAAHHAMAR